MAYSRHRADPDTIRWAAEKLRVPVIDHWWQTETGFPMVGCPLGLDSPSVLGLGNIGPLASKPVMEGKGLLFKAFADIDVFDIEVDRIDVDEFVEAVKAIAPTFGGINLEDIKAPECFEIERRLVSELDIPVMQLTMPAPELPPV